MSNWKQFKKELQKRRADHSDVIINKLGENVKYFFSGRSRPIRTRLVKLCLINLGHELGCKVYANGLRPEDLGKIDQPFVNREWLFDLHWYTEGQGLYDITTLPLVVECEWNPKRKGDKTLYGGIKYDFQKLVVSNATLRLMIFIIKRTEELDILESYFRNVIDNYKHLESKAKFLFIAFDSKLNCFYYKRINRKL